MVHTGRQSSFSSAHSAPHFSFSPFSLRVIHAIITNHHKGLIVRQTPSDIYSTQMWLNEPEAKNRRSGWSHSGWLWPRAFRNKINQCRSNMEKLNLDLVGWSLKWKVIVSLLTPQWWEGAFLGGGLTLSLHTRASKAFPKFLAGKLAFRRDSGVYGSFGTLTCIWGILTTIWYSLNFPTCEHSLSV